MAIDEAVRINVAQRSVSPAHVLLQIVMPKPSPIQPISIITQSIRWIDIIPLTKSTTPCIVEQVDGTIAIR